MSSGVRISSLRGAVACDGMTETAFREAINHPKISGRIRVYLGCEVFQGFTAPRLPVYETLYRWTAFDCLPFTH